jgi:hypothetical protein
MFLDVLERDVSGRTQKQKHSELIEILEMPPPIKEITAEIKKRIE